MTPLDRLLAAIPEDGPVPRAEQLALVEALMGRAADRLCRTCALPLPDDGYCESCGLLHTRLEREVTQ